MCRFLHGPQRARRDGVLGLVLFERGRHVLADEGFRGNGQAGLGDDVARLGRGRRRPARPLPTRGPAHSAAPSPWPVIGALPGPPLGARLGLGPYWPVGGSSPSAPTAPPSWNEASDFWYELVPCHPTFALRGARGRSANVATDT
jgi:hypothetical protein